MAIKFEKYSRSKICPTNVFQCHDFHAKIGKMVKMKFQLAPVFYHFWGGETINISGLSTDLG